MLYVKSALAKHAIHTARRTPVCRSSRLATTSAVKVPMKPCPARCEVPGGSRVGDPEASYTNVRTVTRLSPYLSRGQNGKRRSEDECGSDISPGHELVLCHTDRQLL